MNLTAIGDTVGTFWARPKVYVDNEPVLLLAPQNFSPAHHNHTFHHSESKMAHQTILVVDESMLFRFSNTVPCLDISTSRLDALLQAYGNCSMPGDRNDPVDESVRP